ncbi:Nitrogen permease regulator 2-like protein [Blattella germanica]|nr:Nitrogen permease regulator 2-like protein [Blattella germanica]
MFCEEQWDLTTNQEWSGSCWNASIGSCALFGEVVVFPYYGVVALIPIFQYSNIYAATPKLKMLAEDKVLQERCIKYVAKSVRQPPTLRDIFRMYSSMTYGTTVRDLCIRLNPHPLRINERKLVQFGVLEGIIRRVYKYPVHMERNCGGSAKDSLYRSFTGLHSLDEICCTHGMSNQQLEEQMERDPSVIVLWK